MMLLALIIIYLVSYMLNPNQFLNSTEQQDRMKEILFSYQMYRYLSTY